MKSFLKMAIIGFIAVLILARCNCDGNSSLRLGDCSKKTPAGQPVTASTNYKISGLAELNVEVTTQGECRTKIFHYRAGPWVSDKKQDSGKTGF